MRGPLVSLAASRHEGRLSGWQGRFRPMAKSAHTTTGLNYDWVTHCRRLLCRFSDSGPLSLRPALSLPASDNLHISGHYNIKAFQYRSVDRAWQPVHDRGQEPDQLPFVRLGSRAAVAGRLMLQPVYPQLQKYPCATAVTLGASKGHPEDDCVAAMPLPISPHPCCSRSSEKKVCRAPHVQTNDELLDCARTTARTLRR